MKRVNPDVDQRKPEEILCMGEMISIHSHINLNAKYQTPKTYMLTGRL